MVYRDDTDSGCEELRGVVFDPDSIRAEMDRDLVGGLRMLAAALEAKQMTGRCVDAQGVGAKGDEATVLVRIAVSAPIFSETQGELLLMSHGLGPAELASRALIDEGEGSFDCN